MTDPRDPVIADSGSAEHGLSSVDGPDGGVGWRQVFQRPSALMEIGEDPDHRFSFANERTFLAWIRTALALLAGGVAVIKLVPNFSFEGGRHLLGIPLILLALVVPVTAYRHWLMAERAMRLKRSLPASALPPIVAAALSIITLIALALLVTGIGAP